MLPLGGGDPGGGTVRKSAEVAPVRSSNSIAVISSGRFPATICCVTVTVCCAVLSVPICWIPNTREEGPTVTGAGGPMGPTMPDLFGMSGLVTIQTYVVSPIDPPVTVSRTREAPEAVLCAAG